MHLSTELFLLIPAKFTTAGFNMVVVFVFEDIF
jgi:hypothetical protein